MSDETFMVTVGNIGQVCETADFDEALETFDHYKEMSEQNFGRAGNEQVVLWRNDEPEIEHHPKNGE